MRSQLHKGSRRNVDSFPVDPLIACHCLHVYNLIRVILLLFIVIIYLFIIMLLCCYVVIMLLCCYVIMFLCCYVVIMLLFCHCRYYLFIVLLLLYFIDFGVVQLDFCRSVVIALLKAKKGAGLRKIDIMEAAKIALKCEIPNNTYTKVRRICPRDCYIYNIPITTHASGYVHGRIHESD